MKYLPLLLALLFGSSTTIAKPFRPHQGKASLVLQTQATSWNENPALILRGGGIGGTSITKEDVTMFATAMLALRGTLLASDPNKFVEPMGASIAPGSIAQWSGEHLGSTCIGLAGAALLSQVTDMGPMKSMALGALPCFFFFIKSTYSGTFEKLGFHEIFGPAAIVMLSGVLYGAFLGEMDATIFKILYVLPLALAGVGGAIAPELSAKSLGLDGFSSPADEQMWKSMSVGLAMHSALAYKLLHENSSVVEAMGFVFLVWLIAELDIRFLRTDSWKNMGASSNVANLYLGIVSVIAALLLFEEKAIVADTPV